MYTPRISNGRYQKRSDRKNFIKDSFLVFVVLMFTMGTFATLANKPTELACPKVEGCSIQTLIEGVGKVTSAYAVEIPSPTPSPVPTEGWEEFVHAVEKVAPIYNFPKNVVLAQGALESAHGNSKFAKDRNNYLGINAVDNDPNQAYHFENAEQCVIEYMRIIKRNFPEAWENRDNPEALLKALKVNSKGKMYATDPAYVSKVMSMKEWNVNK